MAIILTTEPDQIEKPHLLVVEDDRSLSEWICDYLTSQGYEVSLADRGDEAIRLIQRDQPDLVILDVMLPGKDGFEVCKAVRPFYKNPILMLTARIEEMDEILGLELGADDYLPKPVKPRVLLTRIKVLLRRVVTAQEQVSCEFGVFKINLSSRTVVLNGENIALPANEFDTLWALCKNADKVITRDFLLQEVRGLEYDGLNRSMDIMISRLRKKLGDNPSSPRRIKTIRGKGYLLATDAW